MNCRRANRLLVEYLDGELTGRRRQEVEEHVGSCARCAAECEALRGSLETLVVHVHDETPPEHLPERISLAVEQARRPRRGIVGPAVGAGIAAAAALTIIVLARQAPEPPASPEQTAEATIEQLRADVAELEAEVEELKEVVAGMSAEERFATAALATADFYRYEFTDEREARKRYERVIHFFPDTEAACVARERLAQPPPDARMRLCSGLPLT